MGLSPTNLRFNKVDSLTTQLINFHQRRITNAADAVDPQDYVTLAQVKELLANVQQTINNTHNVTNINNSTTLTATAIIDLHTLSSNLAITPSVHPAPANGVLIVILTQDGTGGWIPTWDSNFSITPTDINTVINKRTCVIFGADSNSKWMMLSPPMMEN